jgi:hypothetical protein
VIQKHIKKRDVQRPFSKFQSTFVPSKPDKTSKYWNRFTDIDDLVEAGDDDYSDDRSDEEMAEEEAREQTV